MAGADPNRAPVGTPYDWAVNDHGVWAPPPPRITPAGSLRFLLLVTLILGGLGLAAWVVLS